MELKKQRAALLLTQAELSKITGIPQQSISDAEAGSQGSTAQTLGEIYAKQPPYLLDNLIRLAKFRRIFKELSAGNQTHFAEIYFNTSRCD